MAHQDAADRIDEQGLIAGIAVVLLIVLSLVAIASVYFSGL